MGHSQLTKPSFGVLKQHTFQWRWSQGHATGSSLSHPHGTSCSFSESSGSAKLSGIVGAGTIHLHRSFQCNAAECVIFFMDYAMRPWRGVISGLSKTISGHPNQVLMLKEYVERMGEVCRRTGKMWFWKTRKRQHATKSQLFETVYQKVCNWLEHRVEVPMQWEAIW